MKVAKVVKDETVVDASTISGTPIESETNKKLSIVEKKYADVSEPAPVVVSAAEDKRRKS